MSISSSQAKDVLKQYPSSSHHLASSRSPSIACPYFLRGYCHYGKRCQQSHSTTDLQAVRPARPQANFSSLKRDVRATDSQRTQTTSLPILGPTGKPCFTDQNSLSRECKYYAQGNCVKGDFCPFLHTSSRASFPAQNIAFGDCKFYAKGTCTNGDACSFRHTHKYTQSPLS